MGISIRPELEQAGKSRDAEVRVRARRILATLNERHFRERLAAFSADRDDKQNLDLPGWSRFRSIVGKHKAARELFVEMQRSEPRILLATETKLESAGELLADRLRDSLSVVQFGGTGTMTSSSAAALLFVATDPQLKLNPQAANLVSNMISYQPALLTSLGGPRGAELKALINAWAVRETDDPNVLLQNVSLAYSQNLPGSRELAKAVLAKEERLPHLKQQAMSLLARAGYKEDAALLEPFLKDETVLADFNSTEDDRDLLKVSDYAMAMMIDLTKSKPEQFWDAPLIWKQGYNADLQTLAFKNEEARKTALKKWAAWWEEHKKEVVKGK
jgi:hypothetical protein